MLKRSSAAATETTLPPRKESGFVAKVAGARLAEAHAALRRGEELLERGDPSCREILEDAGTMFEEEGDEATVLAIDALLRRAAVEIEESPRSFSTISSR